MPFPRASQALSRFTVLDLTRVRSGPTPRGARSKRKDHPPEAPVAWAGGWGPLVIVWEGLRRLDRPAPPHRGRTSALFGRW